jgi:hypothetical protein
LKSPAASRNLHIARSHVRLHTSTFEAAAMPL